MRDKQRFSAWLFLSPYFFLLFPLIHEPWITHHVSYPDLSLREPGNIFFIVPTQPILRFFDNFSIFGVEILLLFCLFLFCLDEGVFQAPCAILEANSKSFSQHHLHRKILFCKTNRSNAWIRKSFSTCQYLQ